MCDYIQNTLHVIIFVYILYKISEIKAKEVINLKESKIEYFGGLGGRKKKGEIMNFIFGLFASESKQAYILYSTVINFVM